ncbi:MAG: hypothetical protein VB824_03150 [Dehalococcoidia bacterium]
MTHPDHEQPAESSGTRPGDPHTHYAWSVHHPYNGLENHVAVEVRPHFGFARDWRFVLPSEYKGVVAWGVGPPGGGQLGDKLRGEVNGGPTQLLDGPEVIWFGATERISASSRSAYLIFNDPPPHYVSFGEAQDPSSPPTTLEGISFGDSHDHLADAHKGHSHGEHGHDHADHDH